MRILSSEGIVDDKNFVDGLCSHDVIISTGIEFIHDQAVHVLPTLLCMIEGSDKYAGARAAKIQTIQNICKKIEQTQTWLNDKINKIANKKPEDTVFYDRLQKNLVHAYVIPGFIIDLLSSVPEPEPLYYSSMDYQKNDEIQRVLSSGLISSYFDKRFAGEEDISIPWLWEQIQTITEPVPSS